MPARAFTYSVRPGRPRTAPVTPYLDLTGRKFGCLTAVERISDRAGRAYWNCLCDCGGPESQIVVRCDKLTGGQTKSCKCGRGYGRSGPKPQAERKAPPPRQWPAHVPTAAAVKPAATGFRKYTREELAAAEALNASQMKAFRVPASDIAAYLALSRPGGPCTYAGLLTEPQPAAAA